MNFLNFSVFIWMLRKPKLTLEQKLKLFDPVRHGGEVMAVKPIGGEIING